VGRQDNLLRCRGINIDEKRFHVTSGLVSCQREEIKGGIFRLALVGKPHHLPLIVGPRHDGPDVLQVVEKCSETDTQNTRNFDEGRQGWDELPRFDPIDQFRLQFRTLGKLLSRYLPGFPDLFDLHSNPVF